MTRAASHVQYDPVTGTMSVDRIGAHGGQIIAASLLWRSRGDLARSREVLLTSPAGLLDGALALALRLLAMHAHTTGRTTTEILAGLTIAFAEETAKP